MINVYRSSNGVIEDVTQFITSVSWSGEKTQGARKVDITIANAIFDKNQPQIQIKPGTLIWLRDSSYGDIFMGIVWDRKISSQNQTMTFIVYDYMIYLMKSSASYNFKSTTPEAVTQKICSDFGISTGAIASTGIVISYVPQGKKLYEIIMQAYTYAHYQNGLEYMPRMNIKNLDIIQKGATVVKTILSPDTNLNGTEYHDHIDNMINKIKIYDDKGNYITEVSNDADCNLYGVLQDVYTKKDGVDATTEAKKMLRGIEIEATINEAIGDVTCITGNAITTNIFYVDVLNNAVWYIDSDTHTWEIATGKYTMSLVIHLKNEMDLQESDINQTKKSSSSSSSSKKSSSSSTSVPDTNYSPDDYDGLGGYDGGLEY